MESRIWAMGERMAVLALSGAKRARLCSEGSSMFTLSRSESRPSRWVSRGSAPGMAFAWIYPPKPYLEQGDTPSVRRKRVTAARRHGTAQLPGAAAPAQPAGGAGGVIFGRIGQDGQFVHKLHRNPSKIELMYEHISIEQMFCQWKNMVCMGV